MRSCNTPAFWDSIGSSKITHTIRNCATVHQHCQIDMLFLDHNTTKCISAKTFADPQKYTDTKCNTKVLGKLWSYQHNTEHKWLKYIYSIFTVKITVTCNKEPRTPNNAEYWSKKKARKSLDVKHQLRDDRADSKSHWCVFLCARSTKAALCKRDNLIPLKFIWMSGWTIQYNHGKSTKSDVGNDC